MTLTAIKYSRDTSTLSLLDQRLLPSKIEYVECRPVNYCIIRHLNYFGNINHRRSAEDTARAIKDMVVRGAPAIGITAAYGMAMAQKNGESMEDAYNILAASRPTAVNLKWALDRV